mgnify:CR=1 FL=1
MRGTVVTVLSLLIASSSFGQNIIGPDPSRTVLLVSPGFVPEGTREPRIVAEIWPSAAPDGPPMWNEGPFDGSWFEVGLTSLPEGKLSVEEIVGRMRRPTGEPVDVRVLITKVSSLLIPWPTEDLDLIMAPVIPDRFMVRIRIVNEGRIIDERYLNRFYLNVLGIVRVNVGEVFRNIPDGSVLEVLFPAEYPISLTVSSLALATDRLGNHPKIIMP